jgi:hypothetical protein
VDQAGDQTTDKTIAMTASSINELLQLIQVPNRGS